MSAAVVYQSYATYVRGIDRLTGPLPGLLTLTGESLRFEGAMVELTIPRAEIVRITDLDGEVRAKRGRFARLWSWLNVEPNGVRVEWRERIVIFDCERPVAPLLF